MTDTAVEPDSRAASNALLVLLASGRFGPRAWVRFLRAATRRSVRQATRRPQAVVEATLLHLLLAVLADRGARRWTALSWAFVVAHLGMLEAHESFGLPNLLTVARANLPFLQRRLGDAVAPIALATDLLDGRLARASSGVTRFGAQSDFLADAIVWNWLAFRAPSPLWVRLVSLSAWALPVVGVAAWSVASGQMRDLPRSRWLRPAAGAEAVLGGYIILRRLRH